MLKRANLIRFFFFSSTTMMLKSYFFPLNSSIFMGNSASSK
jgi:hypothetical protein